MADETRKSQQLQVSSALLSTEAALRKPVIGIWNPIWLRRRTLWVFAAAFLTLAGSLFVIGFLTGLFGGFPLIITTNHYVWTYGPTAVLVVVVSLWRQVDYCCKINQPWQELQRGPQPVVNTILLDYIWPLQLHSFATALRRRHLPVVSSITVFSLLKIITVISTTLFVVHTRIVTEQSDILLHTNFSSSQFWAAVENQNNTIPSADNSTGYQLGGQEGNTTFTRISSDPVWWYRGLSPTPPTGRLLLPATAFVEYTLTSPSSTGVLRGVEAEVDLFVPNITCRAATIHTDLTLSTEDCLIGNITDFATGLTVRRINCQDPGSDTSSAMLTSSTAGRYRYLLMAQRHDHYADIPGESMMVTLCNITYTIDKARVRADGISTNDIANITVSNTKQSTKLSDLTDLQFSELLFSALYAANTSPDNIMGGQVLYDLIRDATDWRATLDSSSLAEQAERVLEAFSHQVMRKYFLPTVNSTSVGYAVYEQRVLHVRNLTLWTMMGLLCTTSIFVVVLIASIRTRVAPEAPTSLLSQALVLARSPDLARYLACTGALGLSALTSHLRDLQMITEFDFGPYINVTEPPPTRSGHILRSDDDSSQLSGDDKETEQVVSRSTRPDGKSGWIPFSACKPAAMLTVSLPLCTVILLEVLARISKSDNNFVQVSNDSSASAYAIRLTSTSIVVLVATLFNALDFTIATLYPFVELASPRPGQRVALGAAILGDLPPIAWYKTIRHGEWGATLSICASAIGSVLAIVVSGLWYWENQVPLELSVQANIQVKWDLDMDWDLHNASKRFDEIQHSGKDIGALIWDGGVLSDVSNVNSDEQALYEFQARVRDNEVHYTFPVPVLYPEIECNVLTSSASRITATSTKISDLTQEQEDTQEFISSIQLPVGCYGPSTNMSMVTVTTPMGKPESNGTAWVGALHDLSVKSDIGAMCPSLAAVFGQYESDFSQDGLFTTMICTQKVRMGQADVLYTGSAPDLTANLTGSSQNGVRQSQISSVVAAFGTQSIMFKVGQTFSDSMVPFTVKENEMFDHFFNHLMAGPNGTSHEQLVGPNNVTHLKDAVTALYKRFMQDMIDANLRGNGTFESSVADGYPRIAGTATGYVSRLKINATSKLVLQIMLSSMAVLGVFVYSLVDLGGILPRNPCSIASTMALFADSKMCIQDDMPEIYPDWLELAQKERFSLGWWHTKNLVKRNIDTAKKEIEASEALLEERRFAIDRGDADMLGYSSARAWKERLSRPVGRSKDEVALVC